MHCLLTGWLRDVVVYVIGIQAGEHEHIIIHHSVNHQKSTMWVGSGFGVVVDSRGCVSENYMVCFTGVVTFWGL